MKITDVSQVLNELNGGAFEQMVGTALSDVAMGVAAHGKDGEVVIKLKLKRIGDGRTVSIGHTLSFSVPTARGKRGEETTAETPMHVNSGGNVTLFPEDQHDLFHKQAERS